MLLGSARPPVEVLSSTALYSTGSSSNSCFKNRVAVLFNWMMAFLGRRRQQRMITTQQSLESQAGHVRIPGSTRTLIAADRPTRTFKEYHAMTMRNNNGGPA